MVPCHTHTHTSATELNIFSVTSDPCPDTQQHAGHIRYMITSDKFSAEKIVVNSSVSTICQVRY